MTITSFNPNNWSGNYKVSHNGSEILDLTMERNLSNGFHITGWVMRNSQKVNTNRTFSLEPY